MSKLSIIRQLIPASLTLKAGRAGLAISKHSPELLLTAGIGGFVATTVLASRATLKMDDILTDAQSNLSTAEELFNDKALQHKKNAEYTEEDYLKDRIYIYTHLTLDITKAYAPAIIVGGLSIFFLTKSHKILSDRNTALIAAYSALQKGFDSYRARVRDHVGEDVERDLYYDAQREWVREIAVDELMGEEREIEVMKKRVGDNASSPYAMFFDESNPNWEKVPEYNLHFLRAKQAYFNDMLRSRGHLFLNEVYDDLGLPHTQAGAVVGWVLNDDASGDNFVDLGFMAGDTQARRDFVNGTEGAVLLDFNVDGYILDKLPKSSLFRPSLGKKS
jgi:hypothetical protein